MSSLSQSGPLLVLNAAVVAAVAVWASVLWPTQGTQGRPGDSRPVGVEPLPTAKPVAHDSISARPLFAVSRRPAPVASAPTAKELAPAPLSALSLLGLAGDDARLGALFVDAAGRRSHLVRPGEAFAGWRLVSVGSRTVRIRNGTSIVDLPLRQTGDGENSNSRDSAKNGR